MYLSSPKSSDLGEPSAAADAAGLPLLTRTSVPKHALQAFEMLSRSSEAQVFGSIPCHFPGSSCSEHEI